MTVRECYAELNADFEGALERLCSEDMIKRFALIFLEDKSFATVKESMEKEDYEGAFRGAHTLKGVCLNLGFTKLFEVSEELTEELRGGKKPTDDTMFDKVETEYNRTVALIRELQEDEFRQDAK